MAFDQVHQWSDKLSHFFFQDCNGGEKMRLTNVVLWLKPQCRGDHRIFFHFFQKFPIQYYTLLALCSNFSKLYSIEVQYESSITAQVGGSDFSALGNAKYVKICLVVCTLYRLLLVAECILAYF